MITCDEYSVNQIIYHLVDNAIKFTEHGKVKMVLTRNEAGKITFNIEDTGIGISEKFLKEVFEPFLQEDQGYSRKYEGNGLGLALVNKFCKLNEASFEISSEKGNGTTCTVIFNN